MCDTSQIGRIVSRALITTLVLALIIFLGRSLLSSEEPAGPAGFDGEPLACADGDVAEVVQSERSRRQAMRDAYSRLPPGKALSYNTYTGDFEAVRRIVIRLGGGAVSAGAEPVAYECGPDGQPRLVSLSEVDPNEAAELRGRVKEMLTSARSGGMSLLGARPQEGLLAE